MVESGTGKSDRESASGRRVEPVRPDLAALLADLDEDFTDDDRAVVGLLTGLARDTGPDPAARARMRERVLAGVSEPATTSTALDRQPRPSPTPRPVRAGRAPRTRRTGGASGGKRPGEPPRAGVHGVRGRFAVAAVAVLVMVLSLGGMSLLLARDALPGDPLYGIKRTGEAAELGLTFGEEDRAFKHLQFATARIAEIETLAQRHRDPGTAPIGSYLDALHDFDTDTAAGTRRLLAVTTTGDGSQLPVLGGWAAQQASRLAAVRDRLPATVANREQATSALLTEIQARSQALAERLPCFEVTSGAVDDLGPLPATAPCAVRPDAVPPSSRTGDTPPADGGATATRQPVPGAPQPPRTAPGAGGDAGGTDPANPPLTSRPPLVELPTLLPGAPPKTEQPGGSTPPAPPTLSLNLPLPLPTIAIPPLLGLPGIEIG
ncbi:DUF5667 domain-containing protein [Actinokineospora pegani]|uniref:DUF5667 domain-containing protein n=1 Tax=Actinokineospora pegani TaxID=2654637 RepID=UPI0012EAF8DC|nr:DUF5667 domain-containing protein [Actinokineospora pegani]